MKIVLIGTGSHSFGLGQIVDLMQAEELRGRGAARLLDEMLALQRDFLPEFA